MDKNTKHDVDKNIKDFLQGEFENNKELKGYIWDFLTSLMEEEILPNYFQLGFETVCDKFKEVFYDRVGNKIEFYQEFIIDKYSNYSKEDVKKCLKVYIEDYMVNYYLKKHFTELTINHVVSVELFIKKIFETMKLLVYNHYTYNVINPDYLWVKFKGPNDDWGKIVVEKLDDDYSIIQIKYENTSFRTWKYKIATSIIADLKQNFKEYCQMKTQKQISRLVDDFVFDWSGF